MMGFIRHTAVVRRYRRQAVANTWRVRGVGRRYTGIVLMLLACLAVAGCSSEQSWQTKDISGVMPSLAFHLTNENGNEVSAAQYIGNDKVSIVYFGYTYCPDVCPTTLAHLSAVLDTVPEAVADHVQVLFVSVDPGRDTPQRLARYTSAFGPRFIGLTGTQEQLRTLTKRYRNTYSYGDKDAHGNYVVTHSSALYVFDRDGDVRLLMTAYGPDHDSIEAIAADLEQLVG